MSDLWSPIQFSGTDGRAPIVLVCEHASAAIPGDFGDLGLDPAHASSHAVWDIGALTMSRAMSEALDAPLVACGVSRAIYACNRPFDAPDCIPAQSEEIGFPGNAALTDHQRNGRRRLIHDLFHRAVTHLIDNQMERTGDKVSVITLHSFTPTYFGRKRPIEIGFLHDANAALSESALRAETARGRYAAAINQPYGPEDGVTYTIRKHADARGLPSTMIEVRNDLIADDTAARDMGRHLAQTLTQALAELPHGAPA